MAIDDQIQAGHIPRLERIVKMPQEAKPVVLSDSALLKPLADRAPMKLGFAAFSKSGPASQVFIEGSRRFCSALINEAMSISVERQNSCRREDTQSGDNGEAEASVGVYH